MQPGAPWNPYPPQPPPSRAPWAILIAVVLIVFFLLSAMVAGAFFFLLRSSAASSPPPAAAWSPPTPPIAPTATLALPTATATAPPTTPSLGGAGALQVVPVGSSPVRGRNDALVTVVEFSDFQCPFCRRVEPTLDKLRAEYGVDLRLVWKNEPLPFHPNALPAAELALEAHDEKGDAAFWSVHDAIYAATALDPTSLLAIARLHGISEAKVTSAIASHAHQTTIDADQSLAKVVGAVGTPTFFINGRVLSGAQPITKFETMIEEELHKAKVRVASGTARSRVYDEIMREAAGPP